MRHSGIRWQLWGALTLALCLAANAPAHSAPITVFQAGTTKPPKASHNGNAVEFEVGVCAREACVHIERNSDPYSSLEWPFSLAEAQALTTTPFVVEILWYDAGAGVIQPRVNGNAPTRQRAYTRLNTERVRSAYFQFDGIEQSDRTPTLTVAALQHLRAVRIHPPLTPAAWEAARDARPVDVSPMLSLKRPLDLVTTAGIAVRGDGMSTLDSDLENIRELAPLAKVLGFNAIEVYVRWNVLEPRKEHEFDFTYYDRIVEELQRYDLQWFPLLIVGSAYALPDWFLGGNDDVGFQSLEYGVTNPIQSIWSPNHKRHVKRVLKAFGDHYRDTGTLRGVRLGPSGNYGESQYPAGGNWPPEGRQMAIHIGLWCGDEYARADYRRAMRAKYRTLGELNAAWGSAFASFNDIEPQLPETIPSKRQRLDQSAWYTQSMTDWCAWWARTARDEMPDVTMYQSAGGWGFHEAGTDYVAQTKTMADLGGGIRLTNETDSFDQCFYATRLGATAARLYGANFGTEPASSHTARGIAGRIFNIVASNGDHFFTYHANLFHHPLAIEKWLALAPLFDTRQEPLIDVAVYYPETMNRLDDSTFRHLYAWGFNPRARDIRRQVDIDYLDETIIADGFLDRYKVLVFAWGNIIDAESLNTIDAWVRRGGTVLYPSFPKGPLETVAGSREVFTRWSKGDTGAGRFYRFPGDMEPPNLYAEWCRQVLFDLPNLHGWTQRALRSGRPRDAFLSVQADGHILALNYSGSAGRLTIPGVYSKFIGAYAIQRVKTLENPNR